MLKIVAGKELKRVVQEANALAGYFLTKNPGTLLEKHTLDTITFKDLEYRATASSLFGGLSAYVLEDFVAGDADVFIKLAPVFGESQHLFIFCEEDFIKDIEKAVIAAGGEAVKLKAAETVRDNPFAITDALISKDKKKTWQLYRKEIDTGESAEAILGRLVWAMKTLTLIHKNPKDTATTLGISPFVFSKTKSGSRNWKEGEAEQFYTELLFGLRPGEEMELYLEKLILEKI